MADDTPADPVVELCACGHPFDDVHVKPLAEKGPMYALRAERKPLPPNLNTACSFEPCHCPYWFPFSAWEKATVSRM